MSGRFLLDTNIIIGLLRHEGSILDAMADATEVFIPVVARGELYFGAARLGRPETNRAVLDQFIEGRVLLPCDVAVAREYGRHREPGPDLFSNPPQTSPLRGLRTVAAAEADRTLRVGLRPFPAHDRLARGGDLIHSGRAGGVRSGLHQLRGLLHLLGDGDHRIAE